MKSLNSQILRLAIPSILANITIPLVGVVDTAIVGHIANATAIGGIAIGTMLFALLELWFLARWNEWHDGASLWSWR